MSRGTAKNPPFTDFFYEAFMYPFNRTSAGPAAKTHLEAQLSFFNAMSKSLFRSAQQFTDLNMQLAQTMLEESTNASHEMITADQPTEAFNAAAAHAQPAAGKIRAYQQHISRLAADTQVDLAKVAEEHVSETSRTAKALADEVARVASEETEKSMRNQQDAMKKFADPFEQFADGMQQRQSRGAEMRGSESLQSAGMEGREGQGSMQGSSSSAQQAAQHSASQAGKQPGGAGARKE
ncbi:MULTISPECIES: phasin family protein [unclassified Janthinobacterium]|uniref:phasin family protein n=2 Tax=Janthinobacterium TaxID=29580 RepID=UPI001E495CC8|nr:MULTISPECIES: phasin family protein [unclassified Janthinobacterium]MEC5160483.1 phasin family protein [Janthinobacterium sp. CG_S6]